MQPTYGSGGKGTIRANSGDVKCASAFISMRPLKMNLTPDLLDREAWNAFWDAPLDVPGRPGTNLGLPRQPGEIRRAKAVFHTTSCAVKTDGARLEVTFPGLAMGIFAGQL